MPAGQPTKYKPNYCDMLIEHMSQGFSFSSFAAIVNCCDATLDNWANANPEFLAAKKIGRIKQRFVYEKMGIEATRGQIQNFNATAFVWMTKNMLGWRDQRDQPVDPHQGTSDEEVEKQLEDKEFY